MFRPHWSLPLFLSISLASPASSMFEVTLTAAPLREILPEATARSAADPDNLSLQLAVARAHYLAFVHHRPILCVVQVVDPMYTSRYPYDPHNPSAWLSFYEGATEPRIGREPAPCVPELLPSARWKRTRQLMSSLPPVEQLAASGWHHPWERLGREMLITTADHLERLHWTVQRSLSLLGWCPDAACASPEDLQHAATARKMLQQAVRSKPSDPLRRFGLALLELQLIGALAHVPPWEVPAELRDVSLRTAWSHLDAAMLLASADLRRPWDERTVSDDDHDHIVDTMIDLRALHRVLTLVPPGQRTDLPAAELADLISAVPEALAHAEVLYAHPARGY